MKSEVIEVLNLYNMKLKTQLTLIVGISILMMIVVQAIFYVSFNDLTKERALNVYKSITQQVDERIAIMNKEITDIAFRTSYSKNAQKYLAEQSKTEKFKFVEYFQDNLDYIMASNSNIHNIGIIDANGAYIRSNKQDNFLVYNKIYADYGLAEREKVKKPFYTKTYVDKENKEIYFAYINPIFPAVEGVYLKENIGLCIIICNTDNIQKDIESVSLSPKAGIKLIDSNHIIIASKNRNEIGESLPEDLYNSIIENKTDSSREITYNGERLLIQTKTINNQGWKLISSIPISELTADMIHVRILGIIICVGTIFVILIIASVLIRSITKPVSEIINGMKRVGKHDVKNWLNVSGRNEIGLLAEEINSMLAKIELLTDEKFKAQNELYTVKLAQKQAELLFLQSQVNPHFLFNFLECIKGMGIAYKAKEIVSMTTSLSKMFRYSLKKGDTVTIDDEITCITDYFNIMTIRFDHKYELVLDIDEAILKEKMTKMILQPIVENAIKHGFKGKNDKEVVRVSGGYQGEDVVIRISDTGKGMTEEEIDAINFQLDNLNEKIEDTLEEQKESTSIGLINIQKRLKLRYGEEYGIRISSASTGGICVMVRLGRIEL